MTIWITTGGRPSDSAAELSKRPGFKRSITGKFFKANDRIVNWGASQLDITNQFLPNVLNTPIAVSRATNKLVAFAEMNVGEVHTPEWTNDRAVAQQWATDGATVVVRNKLTGHSGDGIVIIEKGGEVPQAPLYTKYVFKIKEFRVHVANYTAIDTQQKIRDPDREPTNWKVRSHENGFIYARNNVVPSDTRDIIACSAIAALGLDFGAVDIIEDKHGHLYVLEVNTAPGLDGQTIDTYGKAFSTWVN